MDIHIGDYRAAVDTALATLRDEQVIARIWEKDHTVWKPEPTEITNRLGWLKSPEVLRPEVPAIMALVKELRDEGFTHALLLGMGGSSLAPEVFRLTFGVADGYLDLAVLDSTDPGAVVAVSRRLDFTKTLFVVSTKSGGTVETFSFFKYFYNRVAEVVGDDRAGAHFVAITDPGSGLADTAQKYNFRKTFLNDPDIGGRYSALSFFGMLPAALVGVDIARLLDNAAQMAAACAQPPEGEANPGALLGALMGELAVAGRDKVTLFASPPIASFGSWAEQLIAESTGKEGQGILPVDLEPPGPPELYGDDRLFVYLRLDGDATYDGAVDALAAAGQPVVRMAWKDRYDLGGQIFLWEMATIVASRRLSINPFDQPNVESAKVIARQMVAAYQKEGRLPELEPVLTTDGITVYGDVKGKSPAAMLKTFLAQAQPGDYVSIQAYVTPTDETTEALQALRTRIRDERKLATTVGYGPRFLHSTGQLHKGDRGNGLFIQFTHSHPLNRAIPDTAGEDASSISFGVLVDAQALGDRQALLDNQRRVIRFHISGDVAETIAGL